MPPGRDPSWISLFYCMLAVTNCQSIYMSESVKDSSVTFNVTVPIGTLAIYNNPTITEFIAPNIQIIDDLNIFNVPNLRRLILPRLREVSRITIYNVPLLSELSDNFFATDGIFLVSSNITVEHKYKVRIDRTAIRALSLRSKEETAKIDEEILVWGNPFLQEFKLRGLVHGPPYISFMNNSLATDTRTRISMPDLKTVSDRLHVSDASSLDLSSLEIVGGSMRVENSAMMQLNLPRLRVVKTSLSIFNNTIMTRIEMDELEIVGEKTTGETGDTLQGELIIEENPNLQTWVAPPKLRFVGRGTELIGSFSNITLSSTFPMPVEDILSPRLKIASNNPSFSCDPTNEMVLKFWTSRHFSVGGSQTDRYQCSSLNYQTDNLDIYPVTATIGVSTATISAILSVTIDPDFHGYKGDKISLGEEIATITCSILGVVAFLLWFCWWWKRTRRALRKRTEEEEMRREAGEVFITRPVGDEEDESKAVAVAMVGESEPPPYSKEAGTAEEPPRYVAEIIEESQSSILGIGR